MQNGKRKNNNNKHEMRHGTKQPTNQYNDCTLDELQLLICVAWKRITYFIFEVEFSEHSTLLLDFVIACRVIQLFCILRLKQMLPLVRYHVGCSRIWKSI